MDPPTDAGYSRSLAPQRRAVVLVVGRPAHSGPASRATRGYVVGVPTHGIPPRLVWRARFPAWRPPHPPIPAQRGKPRRGAPRGQRDTTARPLPLPGAPAAVVVGHGVGSALAGALPPRPGPTRHTRCGVGLPATCPLSPRCRGFANAALTRDPIAVRAYLEYPMLAWRGGSPTTPIPSLLPPSRSSAVISWNVRARTARNAHRIGGAILPGQGTADQEEAGRASTGFSRGSLPRYFSGLAARGRR